MLSRLVVIGNNINLVNADYKNMLREVNIL